MSATYDPTLASALDRVRFAVGDIDVVDTGDGSPALKPDEEYLAVLAVEDTEQGAVATMAMALAAQVMQDPDSYSESGGISLKWSERIKTWLKISEDAGIRAGTSPTSAGSTQSSRPTRRRNPDCPEYRRPDSWPFWTGDPV